jgi:uncharacterized membrane protein YhiD involved in acid resistance
LVASRICSAALVAIMAVAALRTIPSVAYAFQNRTERDIQKELQYRQYKELNKKRQEEIRDDTEKLLQLATELKAAVDKSNENMLSLDVVRKAGEVEKLAKRVKENMKESIAPPRHEERLPTPYQGGPR